MRNKFLIIGAGLSGSLLGLFLCKKGFDITIYEKRGDFWQNANTILRRTIGMSISNRGISAISKLGIAEAIVNYATPTYGRATYDYYGSKTIQYYSNDESSILTIERSVLNKNLLDKLLEYGNVKLFF